MQTGRNHSMGLHICLESIHHGSAHYVTLPFLASQPPKPRVDDPPRFRYHRPASQREITKNAQRAESKVQSLVWLVTWLFRDVRERLFGNKLPNARKWPKPLVRRNCSKRC